MTDFILVFKTLYANNRASQFVEKNGKKRLSNAASMMVSLCILAVIFCVVLAFAANALKDLDSIYALMSSVVFAAQMFMLFTMLFSVIGTLYTSYDNAFLAALPLKPTAVFLAKFAIVYVNALKMSAMLIVPTLLTISITFAASGNYLFPGFYPLVLLIAAIAPLLPLFIVVMFSMPVIWVSSFLKGRSVLKSILTIFFYLLVVSAYLVAVLFFSKSGEGMEINSGAIAGLSTLGNVMYPNMVLLKLCLGVDAGKNFGIWIAVTLATIALTLLLGKLFYKRIVYKNSESNPEQSKRKISFKRSGIVFSLFKKDFMSILRNPTMAMGCFANILLAPIFAVVFFFVLDFGFQETETSALVSSFLQIGFLLIYANIFISGTNMLAMQAYTREGESFFISKSLPICAKDSVAEKYLMSVLMPLISIAAMLPISIALYKIDVVSSILICLTLLLNNAGVSAIYIYHDVKEGNQHWKTQSDLRASTQGNFFMFIPMVISMLPGIVFMICGPFLSPFASVLTSIGVYGIAWAICAVVIAVILGVGLYLLINKGVPLYDKICEKMHEPKRKQRNVNIGRGRGGNGGMLN